MSDESNRAPRPETLEGRVLSGQATTIPFEGFGADPDGDAVELDLITSQPESGSAAISADGESIVYTSAPGERGQVSFRYRVDRRRGATGEGTVRVGVLGGEANPSPVTFTDYVYVQAGAGNSVRVSPLANDIDPTGGALELGACVPMRRRCSTTAPANQQYLQLERRLGDLPDPRSRSKREPRPARCRSSTTSRASPATPGRGLIVVKVVREAVPDYPVVADTVLTAETRGDSRAGWMSSAERWRGPAATSRTSRSGRGATRPASRVDGRKLEGTLSTGAADHPVRGRRQGQRRRTGDELRLPAHPGGRRRRARPPHRDRAAGGRGGRVGHLRPRRPRGRARRGDARGGRRRSRHPGRAGRRSARSSVGHRRCATTPGSVHRSPTPARAGPDRRAGRLDLPVGARRASARSIRSRNCTPPRSPSAPARPPPSPSPT